VRASSGHLRTRDGLRLPTRAWEPEKNGAPRAAIVLVHGLGEHVGRYDAVATRLVREGYAVHGYDQRGHGNAPGLRCQVDRFEQLIDDLGDAVAAVRAAQDGRPLVLMGHSMGGVVALRAVQTGAVAPDLLLLSSPTMRDGTEVPGWLRALVMRLAGPFPALPTVRIDADALSRDPAAVAAYRQDPAVFHGPIKARIGTEMARHGELALAEAERVTVPLLIVHGEDDRLSQPGASAELQRSLQGRDATLKLYEDGPHEMLHDPLRERVLADVLAWLDGRLPPAQAGRSIRSSTNLR
jgi:acylglycerol lipase